MIEIEAGWLKGKKKDSTQESRKQERLIRGCFSSFLTVTQMKKDNLYHNAILTLLAMPLIVSIWFGKIPIDTFN